MKGFKRRRSATWVGPSTSAIFADGTPGMRGTPMMPMYSIPSGESSSYLEEKVAPSRDTGHHLVVTADHPEPAVAGVVGHRALARIFAHSA